jgi:hypothetical protein
MLSVLVLQVKMLSVVVVLLRAVKNKFHHKNFMILRPVLLRFSSLAIYIGCAVLFFYLMMDIWTKFQSKATTKSISYRTEPARRLPCITLHHQQSFKNRGKVVFGGRKSKTGLIWHYETHHNDIPNNIEI